MINVAFESQPNYNNEMDFAGLLIVHQFSYSYEDGIFIINCTQEEWEQFKLELSESIVTTMVEGSLTYPD